MVIFAAFSVLNNVLRCIKILANVCVYFDCMYSNLSKFG